MAERSWKRSTDSEDDFRAVNLIFMVEKYMMPADAEKVYSAFLYAAEAHQGIMRKDGQPYITHPLHVARILADLHMDVDVIRAALLHDVVEDCPNYSYEDIEETFGEATAKLVGGVTKLMSSNFPNKETALIATFHNMMRVMTDDFRVVLIKLSDRLHNLSTMSAVPMKTRIKKADESFKLYIPLARRMGMNKMRRDMQELAFEAKYPWRAKVFKKILADYVEKTDDAHIAIIDNISQKFEAQNIDATVFRWPKNVYRIYSRLIKKGEKLSARTETLDIRILVNNRATCYQVLGLLHALYQPKIGTFKDFIATPKVYGFQALETYLLTPSQQTIKIQIQTDNMYQVSQYGVTAKWRYPDLQKNADITHEALQKWIQQVDEIYHYDLDINDFYRDIQADLFLTEIYVLTPEGETVILPYGANSIDFAYAIHEDLGNHCAETRVDGKKVSLKMPLYNGALVQIIRSEMASPRASWLNVVVTAKAKSRIRAWLKKRKKAEFVTLGQEVYRAALQQYNHSEDEVNPQKFAQLLDKLEMSSKDELWKALGKGQQCGRLIVHRLFAEESLPEIPKNQNQSMMITGTEGLLVNLHDYCHPIPGDRIIAKISPINGLIVHRLDCPSLRNTDTSGDDFLSVSWAKSESTTYAVPLKVTAENKIGILSIVTAQMEKLNINIENVTIDTETRGTKIIHFLVKVTGSKHLQKIIKSIKKKDGIIEAERPF